MATRFIEVESKNENEWAFRCDLCTEVSHKRKDLFLPGAHCLICQNFKHCTNASTELHMLDGQVLAVGNESHRGGGA